MTTEQQATPFGKLSREAKIELLTAWVDGALIEYDYGLRGWLHVSRPNWSDNLCYRVRPEPPSIDWSAVAPQYRWLAIDASGLGYIYRGRPELSSDSWRDPFGVKADAFASFQPGTLPWDQSLVERPEGV